MILIVNVTLLGTPYFSWILKGNTHTHTSMKSCTLSPLSSQASEVTMFAHDEIRWCKLCASKVHQLPCAWKPGVRSLLWRDVFGTPSSKSLPFKHHLYNPYMYFNGLYLKYLHSKKYCQNLNCFSLAITQVIPQVIPRNKWKTFHHFLSESPSSLAMTIHPSTSHIQ